MRSVRVYEQREELTRQELQVNLGAWQSLAKMALVS